jgi:uridine kinase
MYTTLNDIADHIKQRGRQRRQRPVLIAVEGFGGAGKTTFAENLRTMLGDAYVVSIDDFIVKERIADASWDSGVFDRRRLEDQVLRPLYAGQRTQYQKLIWDTEMLSKPVVIPDTAYVIVEGISVYHPDISHYYDYKIWIHAPIEAASDRGRSRDKGNENEQHWGVWADNDRIYQEKYHPEWMADFIYDNTYLI